MTSLTYVFILVVFLALLGILRSKAKQSLNTINAALIAVVFFLLLEIALNVYFRLSGNTWIWNVRQHTNTDLFELHPYLGVRNKKNASKEVGGVTLAHNQFGYRSTFPSNQNDGKAKRVVCLGGSTTYGVGVNNNETWPYYLDSLLGDEYKVYNLGVPGHSSLENLIMASVYLDDLKPDIVLVHSGLNDLRVSHTDTVLADYSNFHYPHLVGSMGQCYLEQIPHVASFYYLVRIMQNSGTYPVCAFHATEVRGLASNKVDDRVLNQYKRNLSKLLHMIGYYTEDIVFIPQLLIPEMVEDGGLSWWIPFISPSDLVDQMDIFNEAAKEVANAGKGAYLNEVLLVDWNTEHFADPSHLNAEGNLILARLISEHIENERDKLNNSVLID